jgi:hypothetical protein
MSGNTKTITWRGRPRRLAWTTGEGDKAKRETLLVEPGGVYEIPADAHLAGQGTNWTRKTDDKKDEK